MEEKEYCSSETININITRKIYTGDALCYPCGSKYIISSPIPIKLKNNLTWKDGEENPEILIAKVGEWVHIKEMGFNHYYTYFLISESNKVFSIDIPQFEDFYDFLDFVFHDTHADLKEVSSNDEHLLMKLEIKNLEIKKEDSNG